MSRRRPGGQPGQPRLAQVNEPTEATLAAARRLEQRCLTAMRRSPYDTAQGAVEVMIAACGGYPHVISAVEGRIVRAVELRLQGLPYAVIGAGVEPPVTAGAVKRLLAKARAWEEHEPTLPPLRESPVRQNA